MPLFNQRASADRGPTACVPASLFTYLVLDLIGRGAGSTIYCVRHGNDPRRYALKHVVRNTAKDERFIEQLQTEYEVGSTATHPFLRRSLDLKLKRTLLRRPTEAALILELADGVSLEE